MKGGCSLTPLRLLACRTPSSRTFSSIMVAHKQKVAIIGSGNWYVFFFWKCAKTGLTQVRGSAIAKIAGTWWVSWRACCSRPSNMAGFNTARHSDVFEPIVHMYVYEEIVRTQLDNCKSAGCLTNLIGRWSQTDQHYQRGSRQHKISSSCQASGKCRRDSQSRRSCSWCHIAGLCPSTSGTCLITLSCVRDRDTIANILSCSLFWTFASHSSMLWRLMRMLSQWLRVWKLLTRTSAFSLTWSKRHSAFLVQP